MKGFFFRIILYFIFIQAVLLSVTLFAQNTFQGQVEAGFRFRGDETKINFYSKDGMARVELEPSGRGLKSIFIVKNQTLFMLSPTDKKYTETPLRARNKLRNFMGDSQNKSVVKTSETKEILDYNAVKWIYQGRNNKVEVWNTSELGNIIDPVELLGSDEGTSIGWIKNLTSEGFFPLEAVQQNINDEELRSFEVKKIEKKTLPAELFNIPADYKKMNAGR